MRTYTLNILVFLFETRDNIDPLYKIYIILLFLSTHLEKY